MKKFLFIILLGLFGQAQAAGIDAFTWTIEDSTTTSPGSGLVTIDNTNSAATIRGSDCCFYPNIPTSMTATATTAGTVSFDWTFLDTNFYTPNVNFFIWLNDGLGGSATLANTTVATTSSSSFLVNVGDTFGMSVLSANDFYGAAFANISNFVFSPSGAGGVGEVPLPPAFLLFGVALAGLGFVQKRKQQAAV